VFSANAASIAGLPAREGFRSCSPPRHWSRKFPKRKKLHQCHPAAWAAWIIEAVSDKTPENFGAKPKQQMNHSSRVIADPAILLPRIKTVTREELKQQQREQREKCLRAIVDSTEKKKLIVEFGMADSCRICSWMNSAETAKRILSCG
jgi:hypothetical protein